MFLMYVYFQQNTNANYMHLIKVTSYSGVNAPVLGKYLPKICIPAILLSISIFWKAISLAAESSFPKLSQDWIKPLKTLFSFFLEDLRAGRLKYKTNTLMLSGNLMYLFITFSEKKKKVFENWKVCHTMSQVRFVGEHEAPRSSWNTTHFRWADLPLSAYSAPFPLN